MGLRNPFTFAVQPGTGRMLINDVGETAWEEIDDSVAGANYGWRGGSSDGFGHPPPTFAAGSYHEPLLAYAHSGTVSQATGAAIVGGTFYNPATVQFPSSYVGMYFYEDLVSGFIRYFNPNTPNATTTPDGNSVSFATNTPGGLRDLKVDSVGNLYYLSGGDGAVHKISYQSPQITGQPAHQTVTQGQTATFTVTATGPSLTYQWQHLVGSNWTAVGTNSATLNITNTSSADAGGYRVIVSNTFGSATSNTATLTVNLASTAPSITTQPADQQADVGQPATFTVAADGTAPLSYQWQHLVGSNWTNVGTNSATFTIAAVASANAGTYRVIVSNSAGSVTSNTATLTVNVPSTAPSITTQPAKQQADVGQPATFTVAANGSAPLSYQWQHLVGSNWTNVGSNSATFTIAAVSSADAGSYRVIVSNSAGSATSNTATLTVNPSTTPKIIRIEAESLTLKNYVVEAAASASGGKEISLRNGGPTPQTGTATGAFFGPSGFYLVRAGVYDENDGVSKMSAKFGNGPTFSFTLNAHSRSSEPDSRSHTIRQLGVVQLTNGTAITLTGTSNRSEYARWDYLEFIPMTLVNRNNAGGGGFGFLAAANFIGGSIDGINHFIDLAGDNDPASIYRKWRNGQARRAGA